jgi:hypothetical protein
MIDLIKMILYDLNFLVFNVLKVRDLQLGLNILI